MARSKKDKRVIEGTAEPAPKTGNNSTGNDSTGNKSTDFKSTSTQRACVSALVIVHFCLLVLALSANVAPSYLQGTLTGWFAPYLVATCQDYGAVPIELTHAQSLDFPLLLEFKTDEEASEPWRQVQLPGARQLRGQPVDLRLSRWPNLARLIRLLSVDQPESEMLSDIGAQLVLFVQKHTKKPVSAIRFVAPSVLSFDQDRLLSTGQAALIQGDIEQQIVFSAAVIHDSAGRVSLVPQQPPLRTSKPVTQSKHAK